MKNSKGLTRVYIPIVIIALLVLVVVVYGYHSYLKNKCIGIFERMPGNRITIRVTKKIADKTLMDFRNELAALPGAESVVIKSAQEVLAEFKIKHQDDKSLQQAAGTITETNNPFFPIINLYLAKEENEENTDKVLENIQLLAKKYKISVRYEGPYQENYNLTIQNIKRIGFFYHLAHGLGALPGCSDLNNQTHFLSAF